MRLVKAGGRQGVPRLQNLGAGEPLLPPDTPGISLATMRGKKETVTLGIHSFGEPEKRWREKNPTVEEASLGTLCFLYLNLTCV